MGPLRGKMYDCSDRSRVGKSRNFILKTVFGHGKQCINAQQRDAPAYSTVYEPGSFDDAVESAESDQSEAGEGKGDGSAEELPGCEINDQQAAGDVPADAASSRDFNPNSFFKQVGGVESSKMGDSASCQGYHQTMDFSLASLYAHLVRNSEMGSAPSANRESDPCSPFLSGGGRPVARGSASASSEGLLRNPSTGFYFLNRGRGSWKAYPPAASSDGGDYGRAGVEMKDPAFGRPDIFYHSPLSQTHLNSPMQQLSLDMGQGSRQSHSMMPDSLQNWSVDTQGYDNGTSLGNYVSCLPDCRVLDKDKHLTHTRPESLVYDVQSYSPQQGMLASDNCANSYQKSASSNGSFVKIHSYEENRTLSNRCTEPDHSAIMSEREPGSSHDEQHARGISGMASFGECKTCGMEGHYARDCQQVLCRRCGKKGHYARDCQALICRMCGQEGHMIKNCPTSSCWRCGKTGHFSRECTTYGQANFERRSLESSGQMVSRLGNDRSDGGCRTFEQGHPSRNDKSRNVEADVNIPRPSGDLDRNGVSNGRSHTQSQALDGCGSKRNLGDSGDLGMDGNLHRDSHQADKPFLYYPPPPPEDEEHIFETLLKGINFHKFYDMSVECTGRNPPTNCMKSFYDGDLCQVIQKNVKKTSYDEPTPIQKWAIPVILSGRDLMACALTGSGKTAAYLLPLLTKMICDGVIARANDVQMPEALILSPTRELATQIFLEVRKFSHKTAIRSAVMYGGVARSYIQSQLNEGVHLIVATAGKLLELLRRKSISLRNVKYFVLDEADRLMDMGFIPDVRTIVSNFDMPVKGKRQAMMFSATFPDQTQILADKVLNDYIFIAVGSVGGASRDVEQVVQKVQASEKLKLLTSILAETGRNRVLIFVGLKKNAKFITRYLSEAGFPTASIHSDLTQKEREDGLRGFRGGEVPVLVASSVAARGLDIPEVMHVINYDMPDSIEEYIHRIGRTGRCGNLGKATSFFDPAIDADLTRALVRVLVDAGQVIPDWLEEMASHAPGYRGSKQRSGQAKDMRKGMARASR